MALKGTRQGLELGPGSKPLALPMGVVAPLVSEQGVRRGVEEKGKEYERRG